MGTPSSLRRSRTRRRCCGLGLLSLSAILFSPWRMAGAKQPVSPANRMGQVTLLPQRGAFSTVVGSPKESLLACVVQPASPASKARRIATVGPAPPGLRLSNTVVQVQVWNTQTGRLLWHSRDGEAPLGLAFSPDGRVLAGTLCGYQKVPANHGDLMIAVPNRLALWDAHSGRRLHTFAAPHYSPYETMELDFSPDGRTLITHDEGRAARFYDVATGRMKRVLILPFLYAFPSRRPVENPPPSGGIVGMLEDWGMMPDGKPRIIGLSLYNDTRRKGLEDPFSEQTWVADEKGRLIAPLPGSGARIHALSSNGRYAVISRGEYSDAGPRELQLWDVSARRLLRRLLVPGRHFRSPLDGYRDAAFSRDGKYLFTLLAPGTREGAAMWEVPTGRLMRSLKRTMQGPASLSVAADAKTVALISPFDVAGALKLWRVQ